MKRLFAVWSFCFAVASLGAGVGGLASSQENRFFYRENGKKQNAETVRVEAEPTSVSLETEPLPYRASGNGPFANFIDGMRKSNGWRVVEAPYLSADGAEPAVETDETTGGVGFEWELSVETDEFPLASAPDAASETELSPCCSVWARFAPGSWARLRTTSVAYENGKTNRSVTETRITLVNIDFASKTYELRFDKTINMGGVERPRESETARFDFWDVPTSGGVAVETLAPTSLIVARKAIPCQTRRVVRTTPNYKETTTLWFSPVVAPYVLRKESFCENLPLNNGGGAVATSGTRRANPVSTASANLNAGFLSSEKSTVQRTAANLLLGGNLTSYGALSSAQKGRLFESKSTVYSTSAPGGVVRETTVETDENGAVLLQTTSVLLDYYAAF